MEKRTVLVTGASRGIGKAIATLFAENNYNVLINYNKSEEEAMDLYNNLKSKGYSVDVYKADVSKKEEVNMMINYCIGKFEKIDVLINNAGISKTNLFTDISYEEWDEVMATNLNGVFYTTKKALQYMIPEMSGKIINISSVWGMVGGSCEVIYSASKAAVIGFTKALAKELAPSGINVNCVAPGLIETDMNKHLTKEDKAAFAEAVALGRCGKAEEVADAVYFLATEGASYITGQVISVDGGFV